MAFAVPYGQEDAPNPPHKHIPRLATMEAIAEQQAPTAPGIEERIDDITHYTVPALGIRARFVSFLALISQLRWFVALSSASARAWTSCRDLVGKLCNTRTARAPAPVNGVEAHDVTHAVGVADPAPAIGPSNEAVDVPVSDIVPAEDAPPAPVGHSAPVLSSAHALPPRAWSPAPITYSESSITTDDNIQTISTSPAAPGVNDEADVLHVDAPGVVVPAVAPPSPIDAADVHPEPHVADSMVPTTTVSDEAPAEGAIDGDVPDDAVPARPATPAREGLPTDVHDPLSVESTPARGGTPGDEVASAAPPSPPASSSLLYRILGWASTPVPMASPVISDVKCVKPQEVEAAASHPAPGGDPEDRPEVADVEPALADESSALSGISTSTQQLTVPVTAIPPAYGGHGDCDESML